MTSRRESKPKAGETGTIGNYEFLHKIATGGMGEVFLGRQRGPSDFNRHVVLKRLHPKLTEDPQFVSMFLNEARIAANLSHANIAHIYELFEERPGSFVIAMEYVRGGTVLELLRERTRMLKPGLPYGPIVRIATAVCDALHYAYFEPGPDGALSRVIHRDVSPSNVMVGYDGQVKLVDFGIAKALESETLTHATTLKGKYGYFSPEQIKSIPLDHRTDIFSLGTMLWEMFVGKRLFKRENDLQMLYALLEEEIPRPSERAPALPPAIDHIVMRALARSRDDRYQDAQDLSADLRVVAQNNEWETDTSSLSQLCRELLPNDLLARLTATDPAASARISRPVIKLPPVPEAVQGAAAMTPGADDEFGSRIVIETSEPETTADTNFPVLPELGEGGNKRAFALVIVLLLLIAGFLFWRIVVPTL